MANPSLQIGNDNWAIKEDNLLGYSTAGTRFVPQPITMTRATLGTRVNPSGLVEDVELLGGELVTNGDFTSGANWSYATGWTLGGGVAAWDAAGTYSWIAQTIGNYVGKQVKVTFDAVINSGDLNVIVANGGGTPSITTSGSYEFYLSPTGGGAYDSQVRVYQTIADSDFTITNISVKESTKNNLARVDYDGTSSLLVEPERTNLITYSEDFTTRGNIWQTFGNATKTLNAATSPDGSNTAAHITGLNGDGNNDLRYTFSYDTANKTLAYSVYLKGSGTLRLQMSNGVDKSIDEEITLTSEWKRHNVTGTFNSTSVATVYLVIDDYNGKTATEYYIWGAQLEVGSYATSYIPTSGGTVTRVQETYTKTGISNLINSEEGVLFAEIAALSDDGTFRSISLSNGTATNRVSIRYNTTSNAISAYLYQGSTPILAYNNVVADVKDFHKVAIKYKSGDVAFWVDGVEVATSTSTFTFLPLTDLSFVRGDSVRFFYGKVKQLQVFKTALSDSELAALTS